MSTTQLSFVNDAELEQQAVDLLRDHDFLRIPVNPAAVAEALGIEVYSADFDDNVSGILKQESGEYRIYFNRNHAPNRQRFTIAHELGHFVLHRKHAGEFIDPELNLFRDEGSSTGASRIEVQANIFAAALLMPGPLLAEQAETHHSIEELAEMFMVSRHAMGHRLAGMFQD